MMDTVTTDAPWTRLPPIRWTDGITFEEAHRYIDREREVLQRMFREQVLGAGSPDEKTED